MITLNYILENFEKLSNQNIKNIYLNHGIKNCLGVKISDIKKFVKETKNNFDLINELINSKIYECMYLTGLCINVDNVDENFYKSWLLKCTNISSALIISRVCGESIYAESLSINWINSNEEITKCCGWNTYLNFISITDNSKLDMNEINSLLKKIQNEIKFGDNMVKYEMNNFLIGTAIYIPDLLENIIKIINEIGEIKVDFGKTNCKLPNAKKYIEKAISKNKLGVKKKKCRC